MTKQKVITLLIAILSTLATAAAAYAEMLPPNWALVVAAAGTCAYGLVRTMQKVRAGIPFGTIARSTEMQAAALVMLSELLAALKGVVSPAHAATLGTVLGVIAVASIVYADTITRATDDNAGIWAVGPVFASGPLDRGFYMEDHPC
jgi:hypothetical protein